MCLVGMLHHRKHPKDVRKAYPFAAAAKMEGVDFFYFSYKSVNFADGKISGWVYEKGSWSQREMFFPQVIINSSNPRTKEQKEILNRLRQSIILTSYPVGNKMKVYRKIFNGKKFARHLILSMPLKTSQDLLRFLNDNPEIVIKPLSGNHGKGVIFVRKMSEDTYQVVEGLQTHMTGLAQMTTYIEGLISDQSYLLQPFIECKTKAGLTYDFRMHVQKNGEGKWEVTLIYPRISGNAKMITNIKSGGYRGELLPFLKEEFGDRDMKINKKLVNFALTFANHFDTLYDYSFDELGIDVGLDQDEKLWIFEVNWRPGSRNREFEVAKRLIPYCKYLANRRKS